MEDLRGRSAIVTGASRGIGVLIARALAAEGVNLALSARSLPAIEALANELSATGIRCIAIRADVGTASDRAELLRKAAELGDIDILVNNAAIEENARFTDFSESEIETLLQVDLIAPVLLTRALLPAMLKRKAGHVVNIASLAGKYATPFNVPYSTAKSGLIAFTHSLRSELRGSGVSCSVVVPGFISDTGMFASKERDQGVSAPKLLGTSPPEEVAQAVVRSIRSDVLEAIVAPGPARVGQALQQLFPETMAWLLTRLGATAPFEKIATGKRPS